MTKKRKVPEVLWRIYKNRARTLVDTVISLLPQQSQPSALECRCRGRRCLGCSGTEAFSFLLRPDDPSDYQRLLLHCYLVVSENAPSITVFYPACRWSQHELVTRTIEMMCGSRMSANALLNGYNKITHSSSVVDLLTTSAWNLLLKRIGDNVMVHLLKFTSIFVPLRRENHLQVAGFPISGLCPKFSKYASGSAHRQPLYVQSGTYKKRKITANEGTSESGIICGHPCLGCSSTLRSVTCHVGCKHRNCSNQLYLQKHCQSTCTKSDLCSKSRVNLVQSKPRKHLKPFSWQRRKKRKEVNHAEDNTLASCSTDNDNKGLTRNLQGNPVISLTTPSNTDLPRLETGVGDSA